MNLAAADLPVTIDFTTNLPPARWEVVNDDVMGGVSTSRFEWVTNQAAVFSGVVSLENNGGFASVRSVPARLDWSGCTGLVARLKGDGKRYKFSIRTAAGFDAPLYQLSFTTQTNAWAEYSLPFKDFVPTWRGRVLTDVPPIDSARIMSVGLLIADRQAGPFRVEIGWIKAQER